MSPEIPPAKKPRKVAAKKGFTKKVEVELQAAAPATVPSAPTAPASVKTAAALPRAKAPNTRANTLQVSLDDIIRLRAYEIYLQRGATPGNQHEDWRTAEREVREHFSQQTEA